MPPRTNTNYHLGFDYESPTSVPLNGIFMYHNGEICVIPVDSIEINTLPGYDFYGRYHKEASFSASGSIELGEEKQQKFIDNFKAIISSKLDIQKEELNNLEFISLDEMLHGTNEKKLKVDPFKYL